MSTRPHASPAADPSPDSSPRTVGRRGALALGASGAAALGLAAHASPASAAPSQPVATGRNGKPKDTTLHVIPAVQKWKPAAGRFRWSGRGIVVDGGKELHRVARTFAEDLELLLGDRVRVTSGTRALPGAVLLRTGDQGHGPESHRLDIDRSLTITGTTAHGVFDGTRTVLQLLAQDERIPCGRVQDWPAHELRGVLVDNTPRHFSLPWWESFLRRMSYAKLNETNLYVDGVGLDRAEMQKIDDLAAKYYVEVVPQLNMPGHMNQILPSHPEYQLVNKDGTKTPWALDLTNPKAVDWSLGLLEDYLDVFRSDEWHLGSDEYPGWPGTDANHPQLGKYAKERFGADAGFADLFADFQNQANALVKKHGKRMRVWNDMIRESSVVTLDPDVTVEYWIEHPELPGLLSGADIAERGNPLVNSHVDHMYYDQSKRNLDPRDIYEDYDPRVIAFDTTVPAKAVRGGRIAAWLAWINTPMESDAEVLANLGPSMFSLSQVLWGSPKIAPDYDAFRSVQSAVGEAPGASSQSADTLEPDPAIARDADGALIALARDASGVLHRAWQSVPGKTHWLRESVGEQVTEAPALSVLPDGRWQGAALGADSVVVVTGSDAGEGKAVTHRVKKPGGVPAPLGDVVLLRSHNALLAVDAESGDSVRVANPVQGSPAGVAVGGGHVAAIRDHRGLLIARGAGGDWDVAREKVRFASDPIVVASGRTACVIGIDESGGLQVGTVKKHSVSWHEVHDGVHGVPAATVGPDGTVHLAARTTSAQLLHASGSGTSWSTAVAMQDVIGDPAIICHPDGPVRLFARTGRGTLRLAQPKGEDWEIAELAESIAGTVRASTDAHGWPSWVGVTEYGDLQTGTQWGAGPGDWGRDFAIGTISTPKDALTPDRLRHELLADTFDRDTASKYTVLDPSEKEAAPAPEIGGGTLSVSGEKPFFSLLATDTPVAGGDTAVIVELDQLLKDAEKQNTVMLGFARDAKNYAVMWMSAVSGKIGFDTVIDGVKQADAGQVPQVVLPGDRLAVVLSGLWMVGYIERQGRWHRVHTGAVNGSDDLRDPAVRRRYRCATGLRGDAGTMALGELRVMVR